jgi:hypothetical protein
MIPLLVANPLIAIALLVVGHHIQAPCVGDVAEALDRRLALGAWNLCRDDRLAGLIWEEGLLASVRRDSCGGSGSILSSQRSGRHFRGCMCSWAYDGRPRAACCTEKVGHREAGVRGRELVFGVTQLYVKH